MVRYDYIIKAIDNELRKSHQRLSVHLSFSEVEHTFDEFHKQTCKDKILKKENGILTNSKGERLKFLRKGKWKDFMDGNANCVEDWDWFDIWNHYQNEGELHFTHNHPRDKNIVAECLSESDISCLLHHRTAWDEKTDSPVTEFPLKSMSCESANGSRMTLTRGDHFTTSNQKKAESISRDLVACWRDYIMKYHKEKIRVLENAPTDVLGSRKMADEYATKQAIKNLGTFEKTPMFKEIQKDFREIDCLLEITYPEDYTVNY